MSKNEEIKIKSSQSETSKLYINFMSKTRNIETKQNSSYKNKNNNDFKKLTIQKKNLNKEKSTIKIDYRHHKIYPIEEILPFSIQNLEKREKEYCWLVTYDKLMKSKKILKILNYAFTIVSFPDLG